MELLQYILIGVFLIATIVGYKLINNVPSRLHTPLMSGMNALSGITILGALIATGKGQDANLACILIPHPNSSPNSSVLGSLISKISICFPLCYSFSSLKSIAKPLRIILARLFEVLFFSSSSAFGLSLSG